MSKYEGKAALVTGGTSGIGLATARLLEQGGARVAVTGRSEKVRAAAQLELGEQALVLGSDSSKSGDIEALATTIERTFGGLDFLFVNAGVGKFSPVEAVTESFWDEIFATNTKGAFFTVQRLVPLLRPGGAVVLNTSVVDEKGTAGASVYAASKAALRSLARSLATELLPKGIRVNAVSPGPITTPIMGKLGLTAEALTGFEQQMKQANPMKRFGTPEEVARAALFLAFEATYTTGAELVVDGGFTQL
jgi:NAD(P)-dependent dehydrogenase (short-subunit alcohol dehydrogenase family)